MLVLRRTTCRVQISYHDKPGAYSGHQIASQVVRSKPNIRTGPACRPRELDQQRLGPVLVCLADAPPGHKVASSTFARVAI